MPLDCVLAAKVLEATLVFTTELVASSVLAFDEVCLELVLGLEPLGAGMFPEVL